jgi:hypothetical protein
MVDEWMNLYMSKALLSSENNGYLQKTDIRIYCHFVDLYTTEEEKD